jgi:hypothetical protein
MLTLALTLLISQPPTPVQDPAAELKKFTPVILSSLDAYCLQAHKFNGTVSSYQIDGTNKKLTHKTVVKSDKSKYMIIEYNGNQQFNSAEIYRELGGTRQVLLFAYSIASKSPRLQKEYYSKVGEKFISDEYENMYDNSRFYAYESPTTFALRPMPPTKLAFADLLDFPAFKVTSMDLRQTEAGRIAKISFKVDQALNAKQNSENQLHNLQEGWFELRPDQFWTMNQSEYTFVADRRGNQKWKVEYVYDGNEKEVPLLREIKMTITDPKENTQVKPISRVIDFDFKLIEGTLPDDQFNLSQFNIPERTVEEGLKELEDRAKRESLDKLNPPTPPGGFPLAKKEFEVPPWAWLAGGLVVFFIVVQLVFRITAKKNVR